MLASLLTCMRKTGEHDDLVADRISTAAREELSRAGLAWFDRRGHLWVRAPGLFVNAEVSSGSVVPTRRVVSVFRGTGLDVALALLVQPGGAPGRACRCPTIRSLSGPGVKILSELRSQGLVGSDNRPFVPELFWAVAEDGSPAGIRCLKLHLPTRPSGSD